MVAGKKVKRLSFSMEDRPGILADITEKFKEAKVNITAICGYVWDSTAYFDMTTDSNPKAKKALSALGIKPEEDDVIAVEMPNKVGELDKVASALAKAGVNIEYMYGTTAAGRTAIVLISTSDDRKALRVLK
jgi:hypothetical protein